MDGSNEGLVYSGPVIEFVAVANETCVFMEQAAGFSKRDFINKTRKILPLVYYKAGLLPETRPFFQEGTEKFVTEGEWQKVHDAILLKLGPNNDYARIPVSESNETEEYTGGSIAEDMADVYQDLRDFLMVYRMGTIELMNDAIYECTEHFEQYWGQKLLDSLRILHSLIYGNEELSDEVKEKKEDNDEIDTRDWIFSQRKKLWNEDEN